MDAQAIVGHLPKPSQQHVGKRVSWDGEGPIFLQKPPDWTVPTTFHPDQVNNFRQDAHSGKVTAISFRNDNTR